MDDIKNKKQEKLIKTVDKVSESFNQANIQLNLSNLYKRAGILKQTMSNKEKSDITKRNARLQLNDILDSIKELESRVDSSVEIDLEIDEGAAKEFIARNPGMFQFDEIDYIKQNEVLDELEKSIYKKGSKDVE